MDPMLLDKGSFPLHLKDNAKFQHWLGYMAKYPSIMTWATSICLVLQISHFKVQMSNPRSKGGMLRSGII